MEFKTGQLTENQRKRPFDKVRKLRKKADQNMKVYFYVTAHTDGSRVYHYDEEYDIAVKTFARPGVPPLKTKMKYVVNHEFFADRMEESIIIKGFHVDKYDLFVPIEFGCIQMTGYIPQDSYYYEDEFGQIVTDTLVCVEATHTVEELSKPFMRWVPNEANVNPLDVFKFNYKNFTEKLNQVRKAYCVQSIPENDLTEIKHKPTNWKTLEDNNQIKFIIPTNNFSADDALKFAEQLKKDMDVSYQDFRKALPSLHSIKDLTGVVVEKWDGLQAPENSCWFTRANMNWDDLPEPLVSDKHEYIPDDDTVDFVFKANGIIEKRNDILESLTGDWAKTKANPLSNSSTDVYNKETRSLIENVIGVPYSDLLPSDEEKQTIIDNDLHTQRYVYKIPMPYKGEFYINDELIKDETFKPKLSIFQRIKYFFLGK